MNTVVPREAFFQIEWMHPRVLLFRVAKALLCKICCHSSEYRGKLQIWLQKYFFWVYVWFPAWVYVWTIAFFFCCWSVIVLFFFFPFSSFSLNVMTESKIGWSILYLRSLLNRNISTYWRIWSCFCHHVVWSFPNLNSPTTEDLLSLFFPACGKSNQLDQLQILCPFVLPMFQILK